jgi:transposase-like protein
LGKAVKRGRGTKKTPDVALVQRGGDVKSQVIDRVTTKNLKEFIYKNVDKGTMVTTDDFKSYRILRKDFNHQSVRHTYGEYVRGNTHTNTIEGYFSILKRGINGVFHHVSKKHLHRYLSEFDFRYNMRKQNDGVAAFMLLNGVEGKRLMYREPTPPEEAA